MELRQQFLQQNFTPYEFDIYYLAIVLFFQALIRTLLRVNCHQFDEPLTKYFPMSTKKIITKSTTTQSTPNFTNMTTHANNSSSSKSTTNTVTNQTIVSSTESSTEPPITEPPTDTSTDSLTEEPIEPPTEPPTEPPATEPATISTTTTEPGWCKQRQSKSVFISSICNRFHRYI